MKLDEKLIKRILQISMSSIEKTLTVVNFTTEEYDENAVNEALRFLKNEDYIIAKTFPENSTDDKTEEVIMVYSITEKGTSYLEKLN